MPEALAPPAVHLPASAGEALLQCVGEVFDRRLARPSPAPLAVGFSGGGDSLALLLATRAWAQAAGRPVLVLTVDHRINPDGVAWTRRAGSLCTELGVGFRALAWDGPKPQTGVQAAARRARHALMAVAAREAGAAVLLLGHTLDDLIEAAWMRGQGSSVGAPREWAPSPVWPEGRGVLLLRPLLAMRRAGLRRLLSASGLGWFEDPANADPRFLRSQARQELQASEILPGAAPGFGAAPGAEADAAGVVRIRRDSLCAAGPESGRRLLAMACVAAGGGERLPRTAPLERLRQRLCAGEGFAATLAGAQLEASGEIVITRDIGQARRLGVGPIPLLQGKPAVWDGRFEVMSRRPGSEARPLAGLMSRLDAASRAALAGLPIRARGALPAVVLADGTVTCPILAQGPWVFARSLVGGRLEAACGGIAREPAPAATHMAEWRSAPYLRPKSPQAV